MKKTIRNLGLTAILAMACMGCSGNANVSEEASKPSKPYSGEIRLTLRDFDGDGKYDVLIKEDNLTRARGVGEPLEATFIKAGYLPRSPGSMIAGQRVYVVSKEFFEEFNSISARDKKYTIASF